jgi:hypothetical protein
MPFRQWRPAGNFLAVPEASQHLLQTAWAHERGHNKGVPIPGEDRDGTCGRLGIGPRPDAPLRAR